MKKILVIGDAMIDRYFWCHTDKLSPEAPIPNWIVDRVEDRLGGAANVVANIRALVRIFREAIEIDFYSCFDKHVRMLANSSMIGDTIVTAGPTRDAEATVKNRIVTTEEPYQQLLRFDQDAPYYPTEDDEDLIGHVIEDRGPYDVGLVSDYAHGIVTNQLLATVRATCKIMLVDPKGNTWEKYEGADYITPNLKELDELNPGIEDRSVRTKLEILQAAMDDTSIILKLGGMGCLFSRFGERQEFFPPHRVEGHSTIDPTGAGDTFIATLAYNLTAGSEIIPAISKANKMAGISVTHPCCWVPTAQDIKIGEGE